jgi:hypothetical protein
VVLDCGGEMYVWSGLHAGGYLRWAARTLAELGVPAYDAIRLRAGLATFDAILDDDRPNDWIG